MSWLIGIGIYLGIGVALFLGILFTDPWGFLALYYAIPIIFFYPLLVVRSWYESIHDKWSSWKKRRALKKSNK
ncbi:hypothetical protein Kirov_104 [Bacillus phage Kirov]|uniref:Uncharacterized protein n=1 Tax=Bacillus phage Kirov TaxID=2783539 RepID=A0A7U3NKI4_9CAUD|nr:hypothetical protein PQE67_gp200 [Bacillus phage Kirov]QOV08303.1 hypothetical protein Kirov_104 [Bacillus phage Kirov]